jgi:hypothetical protein
MPVARPRRRHLAELLTPLVLIVTGVPVLSA